MFGIAFDFRRPSFVAAHEQRRRNTAQGEGCRKEQPFPRDEFFRLADVRNNVFGRLNDATTQARERQRRAHDLQERSAFDRVIPFVGGVRKLATHELFDDRRVGEIFERAPVFFG